MLDHRCLTIPLDIWEPFRYSTLKGMVWSWLRAIWKVAGHIFVSWNMSVVSALCTAAFV